jgi:hypothetical protein
MACYGDNNTFLYDVDIRASQETRIGLRGLLWGNNNNNKNQETPWPLVHKRTIPTERLSLVDEI